MSESNRSNNTRRATSARKQVYPNALLKAERKLCDRRRKIAWKGEKVPPRSDPWAEKSNDRDAEIGIACSGGGIRSATFCLGFFQGLAKIKDRKGDPFPLLKYIDFLSTVSGGGYFGGFFGRLITRGKELLKPGSRRKKIKGIDHAEAVLEDNHSPEITWLRNHGRYISPTGAGDTLVAVAVFLRNWLTLHLVVGAGLFLSFLLINLIRNGLWRWDSIRWSWLENQLQSQTTTLNLWWSPSIFAACLLTILFLVPLAWAYWLAQRDRLDVRSRTPAFVTVTTIFTGIFLLNLTFRGGFESVKHWHWLFSLAFLIPISFACSQLEKIREKAPGQVGRYFRLTALSGLVLILAGFLLWLGVCGKWDAFKSVLTVMGIVAIIATAFLVTMKRVTSAEDHAASENTEAATEKFRQQRHRMATQALVFAATGIILILIIPLCGPEFMSREAFSEILTHRSTQLIGFVTIAGMLAVAWWLFAIRHMIKRIPGDPAEGARNFLSIRLARYGLAVVVIAGFAVIDSLGQSFYAILMAGKGKALFTAMITAVAGAGGMAAVARTIGDLVVTKGGDSKPAFRIPVKIVATVASVVLWGTLVILYSTLSHYVLWDGKAPPSNPAVKLAEKPGGANTGVVQFGNDTYEVKRITEPIQKEGSADNLAASEEQIPENLAPVLKIFVVTLLVAAILILLSKNLRFINFSSHQRLYCARLTRAYLGASNPVRRTPEGERISESIEGDNVRFDEYAPHEQGGPLHLVNVTINETIEGRSQIEQRDRKGLPMCLGPVGMSARLRYHATWEENEPPGVKQPEIFWDKPDQTTKRWIKIKPLPLPKLPGKGAAAQEQSIPYHFFKKRDNVDNEPEIVERLTLGDWISISGAAFTTGLGAKTSFGLSSLLGFINVRLGYWWDSGITPFERRGYRQPGLGNKLSDLFTWLLPAHVHLLDEFLARFKGPNRRRWYLSDGGHFENTGCYELLRRRVPIIVVLDCGADPEYDFADLANLVRKARIDFGAEIEFFSQREINKHIDPDINRYFGTPAQIRRQVRDARDKNEEDLDEKFHGRAYSKKHAALARVWFPGDPRNAPTSEILWIKPSLCGDEPIDLRNYHGKNPNFPQETTADQFFDEAQWESYRKLGESIAERLFYDDPRPESAWTPLRWFERRRQLKSFRCEQESAATFRKEVDDADG